MYASCWKFPGNVLSDFLRRYLKAVAESTIERASIPIRETE
jgi:hypothetical protein